MDMLSLAILAGLAALAFAGILTFDVMRRPTGTEKAKEIAAAISAGSTAYLKQQYKVVSIIAAVLAVVLGLLINWQTGVGFGLGAFLSALAGFIGMNISVRANVRTAVAAQDGLQRALTVAFRGGAVTGFSIVGLGLLGVTGLYMLWGDPKLIVGFGLGASLISLFARVGGGIYTKAADVGADLVGKIEKGIPEDDPRNPAVIADQVGDNVGDCAGMGADLFETYVVTAIGAMLLATTTSFGINGLIYPLLLAAAAIFASIVGSFAVRTSDKERIMRALYKGLAVTGIIAAVAFWYITQTFMGNMSLFWAALTGLIVVIAINLITDYYTSKGYSPVRSIAEASQTGPATNIITGLSVGMKATALPVIIICAAIIASYWFAGIYGIAIAAMAMLSMTGIIVAIDSYGPITDNAGGIAEMTGMPVETREITDALDAVGNTTKAVTKGFAIGSAGLAALSLFAAYVAEVSGEQSLVLSLLDPKVLVGLFIGGVVAYTFAAYLLRAVSKAAFDVVKEVRRQFKEISGIMEGWAKPDYGKCVSIVTAAAQRELIIPGVIAVGSPLAVGFILGVKALGGMLAGAIVVALLLAIQLTTGGAAWDNAKKYIETGQYGGKGSETHKAAV
ncbi:MAG: sodium-translocating pyrophosphatase, partial [Candidatus Aenigmatarchaeota archaeon]